MSLRKRNGIWHIDIATPSGQRIRRSSGSADRKAAQEYHDRLKAEFWQVEKLGERPRRTWDEVALRWLKEMAHKASIRNDATAIAFFTQHWRGVDITELGRDKVAETVALLDASNATRNRYIACVRAILRKAAAEWDWLAAAPSLRAFSEDTIRIRWITRTEAESLLKELPAHYAEVARFALATGLRMSNILDLEWSQLDMQRRVAWIHPDQAKARRAISVPLNEDAVAIIRGRIGKHQSLVFTRASGKPIQRIENRPWHSACKRAGIKDFRFHDLRHTWASWHVQAGTPLHVLQEMGGWKSSEMVRRYAHLAAEHLSSWAGNSEIRGTFTAQPSDSEKKKAGGNRP